MQYSWMRAGLNFCVCTCFLVSVGVAPPSAARVEEAPPGAVEPEPQPEVSPEVAEAASLSDEAEARFEAKDYAGAIEKFTAAYNLDPNPNYLFNIGRVYEENGNLETAIEYYDRFINQPGVELESRKFASGRLTDLRAIVGSRKAPEPEPEPEPEEGPAEPPVVDTPTKSKPSKLELGGYGLLGTGVAAAATGGIFAGLALGKSNDLDDLGGFEARQDAIKAGKTNALLADVLLISGGVLAVVGVVLVAVGAKKRKSRKRVALVPHGGLTLKF